MMGAIFPTAHSPQPTAHSLRPAAAPPPSQPDPHGPQHQPGQQHQLDEWAHTDLSRKKITPKAPRSQELPNGLPDFFLGVLAVKAFSFDSDDTFRASTEGH